MRWSYDIQQDGNQTSFHGNPLITEDLVIVGTDTMIGHVYAFERVSGRVRWKYRASRGVGSDILRLGANLYAMTWGSELICLNLETGTERWMFPAGQPGRGYTFDSPAVADGRVFLAGRDWHVYALDAESGQILWKRDLKGLITTSLVVVGPDLFVGTSNHHACLLSQKTGVVVADLALAGRPGAAPILAGDLLLVYLGRETLACLDPFLKKVLWTRRASTIWSSPRPHLWRGMALVGNDRGEVYAFSLTDGAQQWSHRFGGVIRGIGSSSEAIYIGTWEGTLHAYIPEQENKP